MSKEDKPLVNRVAKSPLITLNLEDHYPEMPFKELDLKDFLFKGLILKEKDFRDSVSNFNWDDYCGHVICITCSADAIIPVWAYMLVAAEANPNVMDVFWGDKEEFLRDHYRRVINEKNWSEYDNKLIVLKGCSKKPVPASAYLELTKKLRPLARSIMYGEPCSTVPIYKKKKKRKVKSKN